MKLVKKILKVFIIVIICIILLLLLLCLYHNIMLKVESKKLKPNGEFIELFDSKYHVYTEGEGNKTLIFLSGWGVTSPVYEYKSLYSKLSDEYKIVVIENPGSGYSDETKRERNLKNILEEHRCILEKLNIKAPYTLVAHSAGGIEALYWLQNYPEEIETIISLDMTVPEQSTYSLELHNKEKISYKMYDLLYLIASRIGLTRIPMVRDMFIDKVGLTDLEYEQNELLWYKNAYSNNAISEEYGIFLAGNEINEEKLNYDRPYLEIVSGDLKSHDFLYKMHNDFMNKFKNKTQIVLDSAHHTMYRTEYLKISNKIKEFINETNN